MIKITLLLFITLCSIFTSPLLAQNIIINKQGMITPKKGQILSFPKVATLRYIGPAGITAVMQFNRSDERYLINTQLNIPFYPIEISSSGRIDGDNQLTPEQFIDKRKGKLYSQAIFDYAQQIISYGKVTEETRTKPMQGIPQDSLSLAWQLAIKEGKIKAPIQVTGGKSVYVQNQLTLTDKTTLDTPNGQIRIKSFKANKNDNALNFSFASDFANIPAQIIFNHKGTSYSLNLIGITLDNQTYWLVPR